MTPEEKVRPEVERRLAFDSRAFWEQVVSAANVIRKLLNGKPPDLRIQYRLEPGSILNAYREGDLSFDQAVNALKIWAERSNAACEKNPPA